MVFVIGFTGRRLDPTTERKARILLKQGKAEIYSKRPFAIRLLYKTGSTAHRFRRGIDTGSQHIGIAVTRLSNNNEEATVVYRSEIALRTTMEKRSLLETRKSYRRGRRHRKVRYRKPSWKHKTVRRYSLKPDRKGKHWHKIKPDYQTKRPKGWLPPSVKQKVVHHIEWISRIDNLLPEGSEGIIEVGRFDMARMQDPSIHGEMYQKGPMYDFENVKAYVFARDGYRCRVCGIKGGSIRKDGSTVKLIAHHTDFKSNGATDNPNRMACVCNVCHTTAAHQPGGILYQWITENKKFSQGLRDAAFMNILRKRLYKAFPDDKFTYGNITAADRKQLRLEKSHANDAVAVSCFGLAGEVKLTDTAYTEYWQQQRKKKRSLHEATPRKGRKEPNRTAKRNSKNTKAVSVKGRTCYLLDEVVLDGKRGWITGFTGKSAYVKDKNDAYVTASPKYKQVNLSQLAVVKHNNNWLLGARTHLGKAG